MKRGVQGRVQVTPFGEEVVRAFIPFDLPPQPALDLAGERLLRLEQAMVALGRLDSVSTLLPDPNLVLYTYIRREAVLSSQIEGTQSSLSDLLLYELDEVPGVPLSDVVEVSNTVAALEHGVARLREGLPISNRLIREVHAKLLNTGRGSQKSPGEFRRTQNWIGGIRPGTAHFVPPPPDQVADCMAALERFIHADQPPYPTLVKAALAHVAFETIHPFLDGNGRIGRLLVALMLHSAGILAQPLLYLSLYLKENRSEYFRLLDQVRAEGEWEAWLDFFLEGVRQTATSAVRTAQALERQFATDTLAVQALGRPAASALRLHQALRERPVLTLKKAHRRAGMTFPTAAKAMAALMSLGIVRELTGGRRNRVFVYDQYLTILNQST